MKKTLIHSFLLSIFLLIFEQNSALSEENWTSGDYTNSTGQTINSTSSSNALNVYGTVGTLRNSGVINSGCCSAVNNATGSSSITELINDYSGVIRSLNWDAITNENSGTIATISNFGLISAGSQGFGIYNMSTIGTLTNAGEISNLYSWAIYNFGSISTITNTLSKIIHQLGITITLASKP